MAMEQVLVLAAVYRAVLYGTRIALLALLLLGFLHYIFCLSEGDAGRTGEVLYFSHGSVEDLSEKFSGDLNKIVCNIPLRMLAPKLTKANLHAIANLRYGVEIPKRRTTDEAKNIVANHVCSDKCAESATMFERVPDRMVEVRKHERERVNDFRERKTC
ncbi:hypothetical protein B0H14DRAFT_3713118 [Mycena olivaceomarginata]|nr:hypothetical protein B0H14DRAFT_3713118 [Mycena olivaceomarginata]